MKRLASARFARARMPARERRVRDDLADLLVARAFGDAEGPLFDRPAVPRALIDEFTRSEAVREATLNYALALRRLWHERHPGRPQLRPAARPTARPATRPCAPAGSAAPADPTRGADTAMEPPTTDGTPPHAAPPGPPQEPAPLDRDGRAGAAPTAAAARPAPGRDGLPAFSVPNARSGEPYRAAIEARDDLGRGVVVTDARLPADIGLAFDPATRELHGTPSVAGEHLVSVRWHDASGGTLGGSLVLIVNANPRDLWKNIDADASDPYFKPNEDARLVDASGRRIAAGSKRGRSHAHAGTFRDDDFFVAHDAASGWSTLVVADGAGSAKSSRKGAALAVQKAGAHIAAELAGDEAAPLAAAIADWEADAAAGSRPLKDRLYSLFGKAAWAALRAIEEEAGAASAPVKDYSTTLLCAVHRPLADGAFVAAFWLGDGAICAYGTGGQARLMGKPDSGEFAGQTRFLDRAALSDSAGLWNRIDFTRHAALTALILLTDGVSDPRFETDNGLADAARWDRLWAELAPALAADAPDKALVEWMDFFTPGHHDDRTIALLW